MGLNPFWRSIVIFMDLIFYEKFLQYLELILHDYFVKMQEDWNAPSETISPIVTNSHANCLYKFKLFTKTWKNLSKDIFPVFFSSSIFFKKCQPFFIVALSNNLQSNKQRHTDIKITGPTEHFKIKWGQPYLVGNNLPSPDSNRVIVRTLYKVKRGEVPTVPICSVGHVSYWGRSVVGCQRVMGRPCVSSTLSDLLTTISRAFCND